MPIDPTMIALGLSAIASLTRQLEAYSRGQMTEEEIGAFHGRVMTFLRAVQADADTLRPEEHR